MRTFSIGLALAAITLIMVPMPAYAYLDPGAGSILLQAILGTVAAGFAVVSIYYARLKAFVAGLLSRGRPRQPE
jgi:hypothetical protein